MASPVFVESRPAWLTAVQWTICVIASIGFLHHLWTVAGVFAAMAAGAGFLNIQLVSWFQQRVDRAVLGRVMSVMMFAALGLMPVSLAVAGVALNWSLPATFAGAGALMLVVTAFAATQRLVREID